MSLPSNVSFGTVVGRFLTATADTPDDPDRDPQGVAATGLTIRFTPTLSPAIARDASASPPTFFALADVTAKIGPDGTLQGPDGQPGVRLVASTNPNLDPTGWTWQAVISGSGYPKLTVSFVLGPDETVDLATVLQVPASPGATLTQWLAAATAAQAARDDARAAAADVAATAADVATIVAAAATTAAQTAIAQIVGDAPELLNTLAEIDAQIAADEGAAAALTALVGQKEPAGLSATTRASLAATYVTFVDANGNPVTGKHVIVKLTADQTDIQDIVVVS